MAEAQSIALSTGKAGEREVLRDFLEGIDEPSAHCCRGEIEADADRRFDRLHEMHQRADRRQRRGIHRQSDAQRRRRAAQPVDRFRRVARRCRPHDQERQRNPPRDQHCGFGVFLERTCTLDSSRPASPSHC
jgi:hypothetical protein